jgi:hypothetical protein
VALLRTRDCNLVARSSVSWRFWALEIAICYVSRLQSRGASWHSCRAFPPSSSEPSPNKEGNAGQTLRSRFHIRNRFQRADRFQRSRQRSGDLSGQSLLGRSIGAISGDLSGQSREIYRGNLGRSIGAISPGPRCSHARFARRPRPHVVLSSCVYRVTECGVLSCCSSFVLSMVLSLSIAEMSDTTVFMCE